MDECEKETKKIMKKCDKIKIRIIRESIISKNYEKIKNKDKSDTDENCHDILPSENLPIDCKDKDEYERLQAKDKKCSDVVQNKNEDCDKEKINVVNGPDENCDDEILSVDNSEIKNEKEKEIYLKKDLNKEEKKINCDKKEKDNQIQKIEENCHDAIRSENLPNDCKNKNEFQKNEDKDKQCSDEIQNE